MSVRCDQCGNRVEGDPADDELTRSIILCSSCRSTVMETPLEHSSPSPSPPPTVGGGKRVADSGPRRSKGEAPEDDGPGKRPSFDREFLEAIRRGYLTERQAIERGDRRVYAISIANRHEMPISIACMVTDNRITLAEGIRRRDALDAGMPIREKKRPFEIAISRNGMIALAAVAGIALVVALAAILSG